MVCGCGLQNPRLRRVEYIDATSAKTLLATTTTSKAGRIQEAKTEYRRWSGLAINPAGKNYYEMPGSRDIDYAESIFIGYRYYEQANRIASK